MADSQATKRGFQPWSDNVVVEVGRPQTESNSLRGTAAQDEDSPADVEIGPKQREEKQKTDVARALGVNLRDSIELDIVQEECEGTVLQEQRGHSSSGEDVPTKKQKRWAGHIVHLSVHVRELEQRKAEIASFIADNCSGGVVLMIKLKIESSTEFLPLSTDTQRLLTLPNAGGDSEVSEALSYEFLHRLLEACQPKAEMEIEYKDEGSKLDFTCCINGLRCAVEATRAMTKGTYTKEVAYHQAKKKFDGLRKACNNTKESLEMKILCMWAPSFLHSEAIRSAFSELEENDTVDTVVIVIIAAGEQAEFIFRNEIPPGFPKIQKNKAPPKKKKKKKKKVTPENVQHSSGPISGRAKDFF